MSNLVLPRGEHESLAKEFVYDFPSISKIQGGSEIGSFVILNKYTSWVQKVEKEISDGILTYFYHNLPSVTILGICNIRRTLPDHLELKYGHIGYSVRTAYRGNGYAKDMLRRALFICQTLGFKSVLITADENNIASNKVIMWNGGKFQTSWFNKKTQSEMLVYKILL